MRCVTRVNEMHGALIGCAPILAGRALQQRKTRMRRMMNVSDFDRFMSSTPRKQWRSMVAMLRITMHAHPFYRMNNYLALWQWLYQMNLTSG
jgi:hypothetical protein